MRDAEGVNSRSIDSGVRVLGGAISLADGILNLVKTWLERLVLGRSGVNGGFKLVVARGLSHDEFASRDWESLRWDNSDIKASNRGVFDDIVVHDEVEFGSLSSTLWLNTGRGDVNLTSIGVWADVEFLADPDWGWIFGLENSSKFSDTNIITDQVASNLFKLIRQVLADGSASSNNSSFKDSKDLVNGFSHQRDTSWAKINIAGLRNEVSESGGNENKQKSEKFEHFFRKK